MKDRPAKLCECKECDLPAVGMIILAAGASTRMGAPKQLLLYRGRSFLWHAIEVAAASRCRPIIVVLGAHANQLRQEVSHFPVQVVENQQWTEGISSSIRVGLNALLATGEKIEAVVLTLCDQPLVCVQNINQLVETYCFTGKPIVASEYADTLGVPALFSRSLFSELTNLKGAKGAKHLIQTHSHSVFAIPLPEAGIDIDTPQDYQQLRIITDPR